MNRTLAAAIVLSLTGLLSAAPPPPPTPIAPERLVAQLGSDSFEEREAAMASLEKLGTSAQAALELATRDPNPEVSKRAVRILSTLQRDADARDRITPKRIRLSYKQLPLGTALNDLKARTGINLVLDMTNVAKPLRPVTVETGDLPPWEAIEAFCRAAGLKEVFDVDLPVPKPERSRRGYSPMLSPPKPEAVPVKLADGTGPSLAGSRSTAVRVLALPAKFPKHRVYLGSGDVLLHFDVAPMPGFHWQGVAGVRISRVVDDANRIGGSGTNREPAPSFNEFMDVMIAPAGGGPIAIGFADVEYANRPTSFANPRIVPVPIRVATPSARSLKLLEGTVVCEVTVPDQPLVTIPNIANAIGAGVTGLRDTKLTVLEAKPGANGGKAILKVQIDQPQPWLTQRNFNPWGMMVVEETAVASAPGRQVKGFDAAGKPVRLVPLTSSDASADEFTHSTLSQFTCPDGLPMKLVFTGSKTVMVEVPFRMENVPLP